MFEEVQVSVCNHKAWFKQEHGAEQRREQMVLDPAYLFYSLKLQFSEAHT